MQRLFSSLLMLSLMLTYNSFIFADTNCSKPNTNETVSIRYLGVGALDIHYQDQRVLTDPFYSPQSLWRIISFSAYESSKQAIEKALGKTKQDVSAILIGHGHYDHAADVPAITDYFKDTTQILGSKSTEFLLAPNHLKQQFISFKQDTFNKWVWIAGGWIRVKAMASEHAPQALGINLFPAIHDHELEEAPKYVWDWSQGTNITWLMDFVKTPQSNEVLKRIFIQTSASAFPVGAPDVSDSIPVDQLYLAAASFDHVENYPTGLIKYLNPKEVIFIHWENFFKPWLDDPKALSLINFDKLMSQKVLAGHLNSVIGQPNTCY